MLKPIVSREGRKTLHQQMPNSPIADKKTKNALSEEYRKAKEACLERKQKGGRKVGRVSQTSVMSHSSLSKASFANGVMETEIMGD